MNNMISKPCIDLPAYSTWTHSQLVDAATNYHHQLTVMYNMIEALRMELKNKECVK